MAEAVELVIEPRRRPVGSGEVRRLLPERRRRMVGPFIFCDLIGPEILTPAAGIDIDAHPHIGLSTVTYLLEGRLVHRDSTGAVATIEPGAVNWMTAGRGVAHTERSHPLDRASTRAIHGVQTWVALPDEAQEVEASFQHADAATIPHERRGATTSAAAHIRVAVGAGWGLQSPVVGSSPLVLAEVSLHDGASVPVDCPVAELAVVSIDGVLRVSGHALPPGHLAVVSPGSRPTLSGHGRAIVLGGDPVGPRRIWWNFVHRDADRIEQAKADWLAQRFPLVPDDHDPFVPLPA